MHGLVHFIHGKESGTSGGKIAALATVARSRQWNVASLNYSHTMHPTVRLEQLLRACADVRTALLVVGSSMGGWFAAEAAGRLDACGVFLLAPADFIPTYPTQDPHVPAGRTEIVHSWDDEVIRTRTRSGSRVCASAPGTWCAATIASQPAFSCCASYSTPFYCAGRAG